MTGEANRWGPIHNSGWKAISMDADTKQYPGRSKAPYRELLISLQASHDI